MKTASAIIVVSLVFALAAGSSAQIAPETARAAVARYEPSVVSVKVVAKYSMSMEGRESESQESSVESAGCVVDPSGLVAVSLSVTDPAAQYEDFMAGMPDAGKYKVQSEITDLKVRYADGAEVACEVALRDKDLDLAFVKPKAPLSAPAPAIDFSDSGDAKALDWMVLVSRMGKAENYLTTAQHAFVSAVFVKPRRMFVVGAATEGSAGDLGCLAVGPDSRPLGLLLTRKVPAGSASEMPAYRIIVLPGKDVSAVAKQVPK